MSIVKIGAAAAGVTAIVIAITMFFPGFSVEIATVNFVIAEDTKVETEIREFFTGKLNVIETFSRQNFADGKSIVIGDLLVSKCEGRITLKGLDILRDAFSAFAMAKNRKHSFDGQPDSLVCPIVLNE